MSISSQPVDAGFVKNMRARRQHDEKRNDARHKTNLAVYLRLTPIIVAHDE